MPHFSGTQVRISIHTGRCVTGVIGAKLPKFCIFGEVMDAIVEMGPTCPPGHIQISDTTWALVKDLDQWKPSGGIPDQAERRLYLWDGIMAESLIDYTSALPHSAGDSWETTGPTNALLTGPANALPNPIEARDGEDSEIQPCAAIGRAGRPGAVAASERAAFVGRRMAVLPMQLLQMQVQEQEQDDRLSTVPELMSVEAIRRELAGAPTSTASAVAGLVGTHTSIPSDGVEDMSASAPLPPRVQVSRPTMQQRPMNQIAAMVLQVEQGGGESPVNSGIISAHRSVSDIMTTSLMSSNALGGFAGGGSQGGDADTDMAGGNAERFVAAARGGAGSRMRQRSMGLDTFGSASVLGSSLRRRGNYQSSSNTSIRSALMGSWMSGNARETVALGTGDSDTVRNDQQATPEGGSSSRTTAAMITRRRQRNGSSDSLTYAIRSALAMSPRGSSMWRGSVASTQTQGSLGGDEGNSSATRVTTSGMRIRRLLTGGSPKMAPPRADETGASLVGASPPIAILRRGSLPSMLG